MVKISVKMYLHLWLVFVIAAAGEGANKSRQRRVIGGVHTSVMMFPYHAGLQWKGHYVCDGSIISANYILTAGHCVVGESITSLRSHLKIVVGSTYANSSRELIGVKSVKLHELFYKNMSAKGLITNDIALVKLERPIEFNYNKQPITLYNSGEHTVEGQNATIIGWGFVDHNRTLPIYLQTTVVQIMGNENCSKIYESMIGQVAPGQFCASANDTDACEGDSGGALVIDDRQAGIISWGLGCATKYPGIYVDVSYYRDWIKKNTGV